MRVLVCGGRDFNDQKAVSLLLDTIRPDLIITGGARGADFCAAEWARQRGVPHMLFPAPWEALHKGAGPTRNRWMLEWGEPDLVVAFPGGRGTESMVKMARDAGVQVREAYVGD